MIGRDRGATTMLDTILRTLARAPASLSREPSARRWAPARDDLQQALICSWLLVSALGALVVLAAGILPERLVSSASLAVQASHHAGPCFLCGMTRALTALAAGDLEGALAFHPWSFALVLAVLANGVLATLFLLHRVRPRYVTRSCPGR